MDPSTMMQRYGMWLLFLFLLSLVWWWGYEVGVTTASAEVQEPCSVSNAKSSEERPVYPSDEEWAGRGFPGADDQMTCEGWNACPCEVDCEKKVMASCEGNF